jgi:diguanylate cyclase (GGDEF)-like protein
LNPPSDQRQYSWSLVCEENFRYAGLVAAFLGIPFLAGSVVNGFGLPELLIGALIGLVLLDAVWQGWRNRQLINRSFVLALAGVAVAWLMFDSSAVMRLLAVPLIFAFHFMLEQRHAVILNGLFLAGALPLLLLQPGTGEPVTIAAVLLLSSVTAGFFATVVRRQLRRLEEQTATDTLTGAFNRRHFDTRLTEEVQNRKRHGRPASLIIFDIDHFKSINDSFGHDTGDRVLRILVDTVKARVRLTDEVFRVGGEEFGILLPDTRIDSALKLAQDITDMIAKVRVIEGGPVSISCGVGELQPEERSAEWVKRCDLALYTAKNEGRGRVCRAPKDLQEPHGALERPANHRAG